MSDVTTEIIAVVADELRRGIKNKGCDDAKVIPKGIKLEGCMSMTGPVFTGPAVHITLGNAYRFENDNINLRAVVYVRDGLLVVTLVYRSTHFWCVARADLGAVDLNEPDILDRLATVLARIGIQYTPTNNTKE